MAQENTTAPTWPKDIFDALKRLDIRQVAFVPDAGHTQLIKACEADNQIETVSLTSEIEGVAMCAGAWLGGQRSALLMQSSGVGNCINMLSIIEECRFPLLAVITMRGEWGEFNPWQWPMGQATPATLEAMGVIVERPHTAEEIGPAVYASGMMAFQSNKAFAVLVSQRIIGFKDWSK